MARLKTERARIDAKCTPQAKDQLGKKIIAVGFTYSRSGNVEPGFSEFVELLSSKPLSWFQENFTKEIDKIE